MTTRDLNDFFASLCQRLNTDGTMKGTGQHDFDQLAALLVACRDTGRAIVQGKTGHPSLWEGLTDLAALACSIAIKPEQALRGLVGYRIVPYGDPVTTGYRIEKNAGGEWSTLPGMYLDTPAALRVIEDIDPNHGEIALPEGASITPAPVAGEPVRCVPRIPAPAPISSTFRVMEVIKVDPISNAETGSGKFSVQLRRYDGAGDRWSNQLDDNFAPELYPFRKFDTVDDAEAAILAWGKRVGVYVTVERGDGSIVTVAPGATFPRMVVDRVKFYPYDPGVNQPPATIEGEISYRIRPNMITAERGWKVWQWKPDHKCMVGILADQSPFMRYSDAIAAIEKAQATGVIYVELPRPIDVERWRKAGFDVDLPGFGDYEAAERDISAPALDPVTIPPAKPLPTPAGTRYPVLVDDDLWAIDEWNGEQWSRIADGLEWHEVEQHLRPIAFPETGETIKPGVCEIRPSNVPGWFDVFQWSGVTWKQIAGEVSQKTAEGVVNARYLESQVTRKDDDEKHANPIKATVLKQMRTLMKATRTDLTSIKTAIERKPVLSDYSVDEIRMLIVRIEEIVDDSLARFIEG